MRLRTIFEGVRDLIAEHAPDAVALEESYVGADARIALSVGQARGAVLVAAASAGVDCAEYAPARVKQTVCGYGRAEKATDAAHGEAHPRLEAEPSSSHEADAFAVAICHALAPLARSRRRGDLAPARHARGPHAPTGSSSTSAASATSSPRRRARSGRLTAYREVTLETYLHVREDALQLYGFADAGERALFVQPPRGQRDRAEGRPRGRLERAAGELRRAIVLGDAARFQAIPGIGKKTAERIVLELKESIADARLDAGAVVAATLVEPELGRARRPASELGDTPLARGRAGRLRTESIPDSPSEERAPRSGAQDEHA